MAFFRKSKLMVPALNFERKSSIIDQKKREAQSPRTNRSLSSDRAVPSPGRLKICKDLGLKPSDAPLEVHGKLSCQCTICQNKLNESKKFVFRNLLR